MTDRPDYRTALDRTGLLIRLAALDPRVAGTPPLGLDVPTSDIDVLCHAPEPADAARLIRGAFGAASEFSMRRRRDAGQTLIASFRAHGWPFEIFASPQPVERQAGWCHFVVERRLLAVADGTFRSAVMELRRAGRKTEPAFAATLGLSGDPYVAMLALADADDGRLRAVLLDAGFGTPAVPTPRPGRID